jgi:hypothetical protein
MLARAILARDGMDILPFCRFALEVKIKKGGKVPPF